ncbi:MAG TPA: isopentenyl-diphosphate Delta-isomerase [Candidatus Saccharimonadales bacterium]
MNDPEQIVFVNEGGTPTGEAGPKLESHGSDTKLHLAFSCYIFRPSDNKFLVTQRAHSKKVWPDVWTNSVCGHPAPGETIEDAIRRRAEYELGIENLSDIACVLPDYCYTSPPYNGIIENEFCPVYVAYASAEVQPNIEEVEAYLWLDWGEYVQMLNDKDMNTSYWAQDQYPRLKDRQPFMALMPEI